jgi:hypothetical protein
MMKRAPILSYMPTDKSFRKTHSLLGYLSLIGPIYELRFGLIGFHGPWGGIPLLVLGLLSPAIAIAAIYGAIKHHRSLFIPVACLCVYPLFIVRLGYLANGF